MVGGGGASRQDIERGLALVDAVAVNGLSEERLVGGIVAAKIEEKAVARAHSARDRGSAAPSLLPAAGEKAGSEAAWAEPRRVGARRHRVVAPRDTPSGENMRERDDVLLSVAAVDAERVQFHQLARVVFVDALEPGARADRA